MSSKKNRFEVRGLIASFVIIAVCEVFFLMDVYADFFRIDIDTTWFDHDQIELIAVLTLSFSLVVIGLQIIRLLKRHRQAEEVVETASGELYHVIQKHFVGWRLSPSEKEVAFLLIKGMSTQEIADLRATKVGTVKSQTSSIYQKANLKGRNELVAFFVEDLLSGKRSCMKTDLKALESPYPLRRKFNVFIVPLLILLTVLIAGVMSAGSTRIIKSIYLEISQNRADIIARALQEVNEEVWLDLQQTRAPQALFETPQGQTLLKTLRGEVKELGLSHLKIYGKDGLLLYSSEEEEIGQFDPSTAYEKAAIGHRSLVEKKLPDGPKLYELYVPVFGPSHSVVMELYEPVNYLNALVWQIVIPATLVPVLVLVLLGIGMRKVVGRAQADIEYRTDLLSDFRERLEKLVSLEAVQSLRSSAGKGHVDSRRIRATILFSDVRGFTEFCEKETPETVVSFLNQSLGAVIEAVRDQQGDVDKMIGDAVLAHFQGKDAEARALAAAQRAQAQLKVLGLPKEVGIGIFTGEVVVGTVGVANRMDFTVIGDTVNVASRLCSCAAQGEIVMDVESAALAGINCVAKEEEVLVKGRDRSLRIVRIGE